MKRTTVSAKSLSTHDKVFSWKFEIYFGVKSIYYNTKYKIVYI